MRPVYIIAARRSAVASRNGAFRNVELHDLAAPVIATALKDAGLRPGPVDEVMFGNALYGGGNPARLAALAAGIPESIPALTIDTQCCAGLDAIMLAASCISSGEAEVVVAGGVESFSRSPLRFVRPSAPNEMPREYSRPPFTPWADRDPDMIEAAGLLAEELGISRVEQEGFAVESHRTALRTDHRDEIVLVARLQRDEFSRKLDAGVCARLPALAGDPGHAVTAATTAVEADAAAAVVVVSEEVASRHSGPKLRILGGQRGGGNPEQPGLAPITAAQTLLRRHGVPPGDLARAEIMEAFAIQAMACVNGLGLDSGIVNVGGGALSRGHPIGASGAILAVRLFHELKHQPARSLGLAAIAAAGGLGSALLVSASA
ncbi:thiolase family protein [Flaviflagellibacter deserti]|uniref:Thiolase family protein n=1 Tax=Flaviflagellibacter deserti TaxID=2267266 RepID=A0ABV9Z586_9HYPH